ncbi:MAG: transglycosylase domain-containing protein [Oligoflexales bacterium]
MRNTIVRFCFYTLSLGMFLGCFTVGWIFYLVFLEEDLELQKSTIMARIHEETTLYYLDEQTRIGSIFEDSHRRYIPIEKIPAHMINAIIASEDKNFYEHFGIDPIAITKAAVEGIAQGAFTRGGSTITQQTVKNIVNDRKKTLSRKLREMIRSLKFERLYSKKQILEFYLNQFHVVGNGNGIGIAAKYYFNKDVEDLSLVEAAFIAGSVKGPGKYNPFIKYTKTSQTRAHGYANERKNYVLGRMREQQWISETDYETAVTTDVPFRKGEFKTAEVSLVDLVRSQLKKSEVLKTLNLKASDLNIAGLRVYTTLDHKLQEAAQLAVRRNLSRIETILEGFKAEKPELSKPRRALKEKQFLYGVVKEKKGSSHKDYSLEISFGLPSGTISTTSLQRYAKLLDLPFPKGYRHYMKHIMDEVKIGDSLFVEVLEYDVATHHATLELHKKPKVSGGMIATDKGEVRAVISGFETVGYNRAMYARRQPGSVFKAPVFFAALQLGWGTLDPIRNSRTLFPYQGHFYYPRPDHASPYAETSMLWTGVMSENLASVALAADLTEKLNFKQFKEAMARLDLLPHPDESPQDFHYRVSKKTGISIDNEGIRSYQLRRVITSLAPDLIFSNHEHTLKQLQHLWRGVGYTAELQKLHGPNPDKISSKELKKRVELVLNNLIRTQRLHDSLLSDWDILQLAVRTQGAIKTFSSPQFKGTIEKFRVLTSSNTQPQLGYVHYYPEELPPKTAKEFLLPPPKGRPLSVLDLEAVWGLKSPLATTGTSGLTLQDVLIDGRMSVKLTQNIVEKIEERFIQITTQRQAYDLNRYFEHSDFRTTLGLNYLTQLSHDMGVYSPLEAILSYPLGTNDVTTSEIAKIYQTFATGKTYQFFEDGPKNQLTFIRRIEDRFGQVLYRSSPKEHEIVSPQVTEQMQQILEKVVSHGTGRRAKGELYVTIDSQKEGDNEKPSKVRIPAFGKTGTTNDFMTSYFAGFIPYPTEYGKELDPKNSYSISAYVGYDMNKIMRNGRIRIYGGTGALPMWIEFGKAIIDHKKYKDYIDPLDLKVLANQEWPLKSPEHLVPVMVDIPRGVILRDHTNILDSWGPTNIATTGESYQNPFAPGYGVRGLVSVPPGVQNGSWRPQQHVKLWERSDDSVDTTDQGLSIKANLKGDVDSEEQLDQNSDGHWNRAQPTEEFEEEELL